MKIIFLILTLLSLSFAHKLNLFLDQEGNKVYASVYFASGSFCKNCAIVVKDSQNNTLQEGKSDSNGEFIITNLAPKIVVEVKTDEGHGAQSTLEVETVEEKVNFDSKEVEALKNENAKLKAEIKALKQRVDQNELLKMVFALLVIAGVFFLLKKVRK